MVLMMGGRGLPVRIFVVMVAGIGCVVSGTTLLYVA